MRLSPPPRVISDDDDVIRAAVEHADVPALLATVAQLTGDLSVLRDHLRPDPSRVLEPTAGLTLEALAEGRALAAEALIRYRDGGCVAAPPLSDTEVAAVIDFVVGGAAVGDYLPLLTEELAPGGDDRRVPTWRRASVAPDRRFTVGVIGAGMSGILAAHRLLQAGIDVVVLEKNDDVGGTWLENTYPGCRVDVPNHLYSYSCAQTNDWPEFYSSQDVLLEYFRTCADEFGVRDHIRFGTEVVGAEYADDPERTWTVRTRTADGREELHTFQALVSAVGQLNRPSFPDIPGRDRFAGPSFHSARWDHDLDLGGRRVAVIGTGASAAQFVPVVAEQAEHLVVFQRTPPWFVPTPDYHDALPDGLRWLLHHVPTYARWDRLWLFWRMHEGLLPAAVVDPDWDADGRSVSAANDLVRELLTAYLRAGFPEPDLFEQVVPDYPPIAKRVIRDNGIWSATLHRDDVELVTEQIAEIREHGVVTADGREHEVDVIVYGTGFEASRFLTPMRVTGAGGVDLHERWAGDARAYLGLTVPDFPNLFLLYGPNTNIVINGSIIYFSECGVHYLLECIRLLLECGATALDLRADVHDAYNAGVDAANAGMAWGASKVNSWYKNERGRVSQNWPYSLLEYWQRTRSVDPDEYVLR